MAQSKITLIGIEKYLNPDHSVFETMQLPEGIDKDTLIGAILLRCQEFELLYSDPDFLTDAVNIWSRKHYWTFDKWIKAINIEYDPLYNYDRTEEYTDTHTGDYSKEGSGSSSGTSSNSSDYTRTDNLSQADDHTRTDNLSTTLTHSEKAFNDANFVDSQKDVTSNSGTQRMAGTVSNTGTQRNAGSDSGSYSDSSSNGESGNDAYTNTHTARLFGNIGVTTSQQMLQSELDIARWSIYEHIADLWCQEFCVMVY